MDPSLKFINLNSASAPLTLFLTFFIAPYFVIKTSQLIYRANYSIFNMLRDRSLFISLLFLFMFILFPCMGQSLIQEGKLWSNTVIGTMPGGSYNSYFIKFMGDTAINTLQYKKILRSNDVLHAKWTLDGCIREETATRKVFIYNTSIQKELLLYDFNLELGDSILTGDGVSYAKVTKIINGTFGNSKIIRKQICFFNPNAEPLWIEGIGSIWGVLEGLNSFYTTGSDTKLVCYSENDQLLYHNPKFNNCFPEGLEGFTHNEFAPIGAEWYYSKYESYNQPQTHYIKHTCIKDSTIVGKKVKVIQKTLFKYGGVTINLGYEYLYQNGDTISYWKSGAFHILYNFSLSKGDSILLYSEMPNQCEAKTPYGWSKIDSVYSEKINNHQLKAYFSSHKKGSVWGFDSFSIIEKIGSTQYLLPQNAFCGIADGYPQIGLLRCYSDPEIGFYQLDNVPCDKIQSWPDSFSPLKKNSQVKLYPNPVLNDLIIEFNDLLGAFYNLEIFDLNGKLINSQSFCPGERIDLSYLGRGLYPICIYNKNKLYFNGNIYKK